MTRSITSTQHWTTSDLAMAAAISLWEPIEDIDTSRPRAVFKFANCQRVQELADKYHRGVIRIEPRQFFDQIRAVKARIYA